MTMQYPTFYAFTLLRAYKTSAKNIHFFDVFCRILQDFASLCSHISAAGRCIISISIAKSVPSRWKRFTLLLRFVWTPSLSFQLPFSASPYCPQARSAHLVGRLAVHHAVRAGREHLAVLRVRRAAPEHDHLGKHGERTRLSPRPSYLRLSFEDVQNAVETIGTL